MKFLRLVAVVTVIILTMSYSPPQYNSNPEFQQNEISKIHLDEVESNPGQIKQDIGQIDPELNAIYSEEVNPAIDSENGLLNPRTIEQSGYSCTGNISARTDTLQNTQQELGFDTEHDWITSSAEVSVWNLKQLYALNGTFDEGVSGINIQPNGTVDYYPFGWNSSSIDTLTYSDDVQLSIYDDADRTYVAVENQGGKVGQNAFGHDIGTQVIWSQTIENLPYTEDFLLNFDFFYLRGPLNLNPSVPVPITGNCSIYVYIDGVPIWNMSLLTLSERGVWTDIGVVPIHVTAAPASFNLDIGLEIDETLVLDKRYDYDNNGIADGTIHTQYITIYFDDLSFIAQTPPNCDVVDLGFSINGIAAGILGEGGAGHGIVTNPDYWALSPLNFSIYSNSTISFEYCIDVLNHRFINSRWTTDISSDGVQYSLLSGNSAGLSFYTYLGIIGIYDNFTLRIYVPPDWQNITVHDPFLSDVTSSCIHYDGFIEIPTNILDILGWWKISAQSPNYAAGAQTQRYDNDIGNWVEDTIYHTGDRIRISANISSQGNIPSLLDGVTFKWGLPNYTIWHESVSVGGLLGSITSTSTTFGATNTSAGVWYISYFWTNGTEMAYGSVQFELHHQASIIVITNPSDLETNVGDPPLTIQLSFYDSENGMLLTSNGASISGTWAGGVVEFELNLVKNWWEAVFDTTIMGAGNFVVTLNSSSPIYETTPAYATIISEYATNLDTQGPLDALVYGRAYNFTFRYSSIYDNSGIDGATITLSGDGSDWITTAPIGDGHYNITLTPMGLLDKNVRVTFSKVGYENQTYVLSFLVDKVPIEVNLTSLLTGEELAPLDIEVDILETETSILVPDANVTLSIVSSLGTAYFSEQMNETSPGHYISTITMPLAGQITYSIYIQVSKDNYELAQTYKDTLVPTFDADARLAEQIAQYSLPVFVGLVGFVGIVASQRFYSKKQLAKRMKAKAIKSRFDDANNLLGIIVLHKLSGIPIYSKIMKGGFEEGMLSAFISAIMHFRSEFDTAREAHDDYHILPISDIIRAIPTQNLICAFITISSSSPEQEEKMVGYARAIGMTLDDILSHRPTQVVDVKTAKTLEWYFDDFVDGGLIRKYQFAKEELPRRFKALSSVMQKDDSNETFRLNRLIRNLETAGFSEDDAYLLVMDAIEKEIIVPIYPFNGDTASEIDES